MNFHFYADDCQIYFSLDSVSSVTTTRIEACQDIGTWMSFKILFSSFKALNNLCNSFISDFKSLRSSSRNLLVIPRSKLKSYGDRAFSVSAPKLWNDIPETIKCSVDLNAFKRNLKTYLFKRYFYE